ARRLTGDASLAEDALQDTFVRVHRRLSTFRGDSRFSTWLFRVATNCALMVRRLEKRHRAESLEEFLPTFDREGRHTRDVDHGEAARAEEILDRRRLSEAAREALRRLPESYRVAFVLRDLEEMPTDQVAAVLHVSAAAVRQRVHRARLM